MPGARFDINSEFPFTDLELRVQLREDCQYGGVIRPDYELIIRRRIHRRFRLFRRPPQVLHRYLPPRPLPQNRRWWVGRDDLRGIVKGQGEVGLHHRPTPRSHPPLPCQSPQRCIAKGDDQIRAAHFDLALEKLDSVPDAGEHEFIPKDNVLSGNVFLFRGDEGFDGVPRRPDADHVGQKGSRPRNTSFAEHFGKLLPGEADKRLSAGYLLLSRKFPDNHDLRRAWTDWSNFHFEPP